MKGIRFQLTYRIVLIEKKQMSEILRSRVNERIQALGINPFEAERRAKLKRGYVNDLLIGKKDTMREKALPALAAALECDVGYLIGAQQTPTLAPAEWAGSMKLSGIAEAGAWREANSTDIPEESLPISPDPRYPPEKQRVFLVRGDHAAGLRISGGSIVFTVADGGYREGDVVVAKRNGVSGTSEISVRVVSGGALSTRPARGDANSYPLVDGEIIGRVVRAIVLFGEPN